MTSARRIFIAAAAGLALLCSAQAALIHGGISLSGAYTVDTGNLNTATTFTTFGPNFVSSRGGDFVTAGVAVLTSVTMTPFAFNPFGGSVTPLWSTDAGPAASFDLTAITNVEQIGDNTLDLVGKGTMYLVGYDATPGSWVFTANQGGGSFSWSSSNATVPEGGTTAALLGLGLIAVGVAARRRQLI